MQNTTIPYSSIVVPPRMRSDYGNIEELAESICTVGLICPLAVEELEDGTYGLLAGGRRHAAIACIRESNANVIGYEPFPSFDTVPVFIRYNLSPHKRGLIELEENLRRMEMNWRDTAIGIAQVHRCHIQEAAVNGGVWVAKQTGDLFKVSHSTVVNATTLASYLENGDEEIVKAETATDAMMVLSKRKQRELEKRQAELKNAALALREDQRTILKTAVPSATEIVDALNILPDLSNKALDTYARACEIILQGDSHVFMSANPESVDGIYTDIPYGIDMDNLTNKNLEETKSEHQVDENLSLFSTFFESAYTALRPEGFLVFWYDIEHTTTLLRLAESKGFRTQRWPLHAQKPIAQNGAAGYNTTKDYESVMICAKQGAALNTRRATSFIPWKWAENEKAKYSHPFVKPHSANEFLLQTFFKPKSRILDCYCGEGSLVLAGLSLGYDMLGIDKVETHVIRARTHVETLLSQP